MKFVQTFVIALFGILCIFGLAIAYGSHNLWLTGVLFLMIILGTRSLLGEINNYLERIFFYAVVLTIGLTLISILIF